MINIKDFLTENEISFKTSGKNVSKGWINLEVCPFCNDSSYHCGINLSSLAFHCWVCHEKGHIHKLLKEIGLKNIQNIEFENEQQPIIKTSDMVKWPEFMQDEMPVPHRKYLSSRGFDPDFLIKKYKLKSVYNIGDYKFRIIVPVIVNKITVSWVAANVLRQFKHIIPYLDCPPEKAIVQPKHALYNYDSINDWVIIVEGITDVWNCGDGFVASFTKGMTSEQIELLLKKNPKKVFIMFDSDANIQAQQLANNLSGLFHYVEVLTLVSGDPADLTKEEINQIKKEIL